MHGQCPKSRPAAAASETNPSASDALSHGSLLAQPPAARPFNTYCALRRGKFAGCLKPPPRAWCMEALMVAVLGNQPAGAAGCSWSRPKRQAFGGTQVVAKWQGDGGSRSIVNQQGGTQALKGRNLAPLRAAGADSSRKMREDQGRSKPSARGERRVLTGDKNDHIHVALDASRAFPSVQMVEVSAQVTSDCER